MLAKSRLVLKNCTGIPRIHLKHRNIPKKAQIAAIAESTSFNFSTQISNKNKGTTAVSDNDGNKWELVFTLPLAKNIKGFTIFSSTITLGTITVLPYVLHMNSSGFADSVLTGIASDAGGSSMLLAGFLGIIGSFIPITFVRLWCKDLVLKVYMKINDNNGNTNSNKLLQYKRLNDRELNKILSTSEGADNMELLIYTYRMFNTPKKHIVKVNEIYPARYFDFKQKSHATKAEGNSANTSTSTSTSTSKSSYNQKQSQPTQTRTKQGETVRWVFPTIVNSKGKGKGKDEQVSLKMDSGFLFRQFINSNSLLKAINRRVEMKEMGGKSVDKIMDFKY